MARSIHSPRRILIATIMAIVLFAGGVAATGFATEPLDPEVPDGFHVPAAHVGDRAVYDMSTWRGGDVTGPFPYARLQWHADQDIHDAHGRPHRVHVLEQSIAEWHLENGAHHWGLDGQQTVFLAGQDPVAYRAGRVNDSKAVQQPFDGLGVVVTSSESAWDAGFQVYFDEPVPVGVASCLARSGLQGTQAPTKVDLFGPCELYDADVPASGRADDRPEARSFSPHQAVEGRLLGSTEMEGQPVVVYGVEGPRQGLPMDLQVWFQDGVPYPIRVVWPVEDGFRVIRLVSWERGDTPLKDGTPGIGHAPAVRMAGIAQHGPDEHGVDARFPASDAWRHAREDADVASFLAHHSEPRLISSGFQSFRISQGQTDLTWSFSHIADGDVLETRVTRTMEAGVLPGMPDLVPQTLWGDEAQVTSRVDEPSDYELRLQGADIESQAATLASAFEQWRRYTAGTVGDDPAWAVQLRCQDRECSRVAYHVAAGIVAQAWDTDVGEAGLQQSSSMFIDLVWIAPDGRVRERQSVTASSGHQTAPGIMQAPEEGDDAPALAVVSPGWAPGPTAAGIGAAAALVALAYYFWPVLKGGAIGLFSRIRDDEVLEHPSRRQLHDAVHAQPGIHHQALVEVLGKGRGAAEHHLRKLAESGVVRCRTSGGYRCYFPRRTDRRLMDAAPALRSATARRVLEHVREHPGATGGQVAAALGVTRSTVSHHVERMAGAGVLRKERGSNGFHLWSTSLVAA